MSEVTATPTEAAPTPAPAENPSPPSEGITPEAVRGHTNTEPVLPDRNVLGKRIGAVLGRAQSLEQHAKVQNEAQAQKEELALLRRLATTDRAAFMERSEDALENIKGTEDGQHNVSSQIRKEIEELRALMEQQQHAQAQAVAEAELSAIQHSVSQFVEGAGDSYKAINAANASELVFQKMLQHYQQTGQEISETQAASEVEKSLVEFVETLAPKLGWTKSDVQRSSEEGAIETPTLGSDVNETLGQNDLASLSRAERLKAIMRKHNMR